MNKRINPTGLKGSEITNRMRDLMGIKESEIKVTPVHSIKLTKKGPDGKAYGIVKENNKYFLKVANINEDGSVTEAFNYIGGLENKIKESYSSYSKATRMLQNKFNEIGKRLNIGNETNILRNDNLLAENYTGVAFSEGMDDVDVDEVNEVEDIYEIEEIAETEETIEEKLDDDGDSDKSDGYLLNKRDVISKSMNEIDELYESVMGKKKILK